MLEVAGAQMEIVERVRAENQALEPQLAEACRADAWSAELRTCLVQTAPEKIRDCEPLFEQAQIDHMVQIREAAQPKDEE